MNKITDRNCWQTGFWVLICLVFFASNSIAQPGNPSTVNYFMENKVAAAESLPIKMLSLASDSSFWLGTDSFAVSSVVTEGSEVTMGITSNLPYTKARFKNDTLLISLFQFDRQYVNELEIKVIDHHFKTRLLIHARNGLSLVKVIPTDQVLVLGKSNFNPGDIISGFVNFRGTLPLEEKKGKNWNSARDYVESKYTARGPFRVKIE